MVYLIDNFKLKKIMFIRRILTPDDNAVNVKYNIGSGISHSILRESSPVDDFYMEMTKPSDDTMESVSFVDPILMLFNQDRLANLGDMGAKAFLDSLQQRESSLAELRSKVSDEDLLAMLKSRYLQTPSEVAAWCRYIDGNITKFNQELQQLIESNKDSIEKETPVENNNLNQTS